MASRYNLRNGSSKKPKNTKRKRPSSIDKLDDDTEPTESANTGSKLQNYLKIIIDDMVEEQLEEQMEDIFEVVDDHLDIAFSEKLKQTSKRFAKMTMPYIKTSILEACHDMIHEHLDTLDISMGTEQFKKLISQVIQADFGGVLNGKKAKASKKGTTKIKINKSNFLQAVQPQQPDQLNIQPKNTNYPKEYDEEVLKDHKDGIINQIVALEASKENKTVIYKQYLSGITPTGKSKRYAKQQAWLDNALAMPYQKKIDYPISASDPNTRIHSFLHDVQHRHR